MLAPGNATMQKMTLPMGTMSKAMASMTMTMRRAGLGTLKPFAESPTGRLGAIAPDVANAGMHIFLTVSIGIEGFWRPFEGQISKFKPHCFALSAFACQRLSNKEKEVNVSAMFA